MNDDSPPLLRVVHGGEPAADELAALVVALSRRAQEGDDVRRSAWADRRAALRSPLPRGAQGWRDSGRTFTGRTGASW